MPHRYLNEIDADLLELVAQAFEEKMDEAAPSEQQLEAIHGFAGDLRAVARRVRDGYGCAGTGVWERHCPVVELDER
jgi:hypothetical protein